VKNLYTLALILVGLGLQAQSVISDQGGNPVVSPDAILELQSTTKGMLLSKMSQTQRDAINSPSNGLLIHNTTSNCIQVYFTQQGWTDVECDCPTPPSAE
jgi:hypothetical protein